jgi:hypothetical protein
MFSSSPTEPDAWVSLLVSAVVTALVLLIFTR